MLSRKLGEAVVIDRDIRIVYLGTDRSQLKLGFESRTHHEIEREELVGAAPSMSTRNDLLEEVFNWICLSRASDDVVQNEQLFGRVRRALGIKTGK